MDHEFKINMQLKELDNSSSLQKEELKEKGKDKRETAKFESKGMDSMEGGLGVAGLTSN